MSRSNSAIEWLLEPWLRGHGPLARAGRVAAIAALLTLVILPGMILYFGASGWWWDTTLSICLLAPAGIVLFDNAADLAGRLLGRPLGGIGRIALLVLGFLLGNVAGYVVVFFLRPLPGRSAGVMVADFERNIVIFAPIIAVSIVLGASLWYRAEAYRLESVAATASFSVLRGQMQPHFLFNALNALKELILDDPERARDFAQRLADLYRMILKVSTEATTPLSDELAIVEHYLEVERVRYGDRLRYRIDAPDELQQEHVPSLLLQTLAENAVKHGIGKARQGGEIRVTARRGAGGGLALEVSNTGAAFVASGEPKNGSTATGLANTRARIELMYGKRGELGIATDPELGTRVRVVVSGEKLG